MVLVLSVASNDTFISIVGSFIFLCWVLSAYKAAHLVRYPWDLTLRKEGCMVKAFFIAHCGHTCHLFLGRFFCHHCTSVSVLNWHLLPLLILGRDGWNWQWLVQESRNSSRFPVKFVTACSCVTTISLQWTASIDSEFFLLYPASPILCNGNRECLHVLDFISIFLLLHAKMGPRNFCHWPSWVCVASGESLVLPHICICCLLVFVWFLVISAQD